MTAHVWEVYILSQGNGEFIDVPGIRSLGTDPHVCLVVMESLTVRLYPSEITYIQQSHARLGAGHYQRQPVSKLSVLDISRNQRTPMMQPRLLSLILGALAFTLPSHVSAFSDTSPYFLISSVSTYVLSSLVSPSSPVANNIA